MSNNFKKLVNPLYLGKKIQIVKVFVKPLDFPTRGNSHYQKSWQS